MILLLVFFIGFVAGLRSMTAPAVVAWGVRLGWISLAGSHLNFFAHPAALVILTFCAVGELVADKLPFIPGRTTPGPLIFRILSGAVCGSALCITSDAAIGYGIVLGAVGAVAGAFAGFNYRLLIPAGNATVQVLAALVEDAVAVCGGFWIVSRF